MDKYDRLMQEIVAYLQGTWLAKAPDNNYRFHDRGPISGSSEAEIEEAEQHVGKKLPAALKAWYRVAGKVPPYFYDYDMDLSIKDFLNAQETAVELTQEEYAEWQLTDNILPFSQRIGEQFLFVDTALGEAEDPPVFHCMEGEHPTPVTVAFSCYIREAWLQWLNVSNEEPLTHSQLVEVLRTEANEFRCQLIERVHHEDLTHDEITGPRQFQERWLEAFSKSEVWNRMQSEGLRMPYGWITPPA